MLTEYKKVRQIKGEPKRRWFSDEYFDLIVWFLTGNEIMGFQLCYGKPGDQRAITWKWPDTYFHQRIDDGENRPGKPKATPILVPDGRFDYEVIAEKFQKESANIDPEISKFVFDTLSQYRS
jgi:hypothetical protein